MLKSIAQQMKGDSAGARDGYEKLLKTNPRFAPAANNLAWMLAEEGPDKDLPRALLLAQAARDAAPQDPQIADTLGWVLYKQGAYPRAEALLREAAEKLPTNAEVLYHLGMAQAKLGQERRGARVAREEPGAVGRPPRRRRGQGDARDAAGGEVGGGQPSSSQRRRPSSTAASSPASLHFSRHAQRHHGRGSALGHVPSWGRWSWG